MAYINRDAGKKEINTAEVVKYLTRSFNRAISSSTLSNRTARTNATNTTHSPLYLAQVDFCYIIDNIQRGPAYIAPKFIQDANQLIAEVEQL